MEPDDHRPVPQTVGRPQVRRRVLLLVLILLGAAVAAVFLVEEDSDTNGAGDDRPELAGNQALLSGKVVDATTKAPLPGARIVIDQEGGRLTVVADDDGRYQKVINASRPIGFTADAPAHQGTAGFGKLCPGERRQLDLQLPPASSRSAPPAPVVLKGEC